MQFLSWFILGLLLSAFSIVSINRSVSILFYYKSMRTYWMRYVFRLLLVGFGLLLAVQWGAEQILAVFFGLIIFRLMMLFPKFARYFTRS